MTDGRLVLVFDDGYAEDDELVRPVLADRGVPAVLAIVPTWLDDDSLTTDQLRALDDSGWEVAAHGHRHRKCQAHGLVRDAAAGSDRLYLGGGHGFPEDEVGVLAGDELEVTDGTSSETVAVTATGADGDAGDGAFVDLEAPLGTHFAPGETVVRPTEALLRDELVGGRDALAELGFDPTTFVFPFDAASVRAWRMARDEFDAVANAAVRSLPNPPGTAPTNLRRWYLETSHLAPPEAADYLDAVAEEGGLGVLAGHSAWDTVTPERVGMVVDAALERGIEITTFAEL